MDIKEFDDLVKGILDEIKERIANKGKEYTPPHGDRLWAFKEIGRRRKMEPEQACRALVTKHLVAIDDHIDQLLPDGPPIVSLDQWREWLRDEIVYAILLEALLVERILQWK